MNCVYESITRDMKPLQKGRFISRFRNAPLGRPRIKILEEYGCTDQKLFALVECDRRWNPLWEIAYGREKLSRLLGDSQAVDYIRFAKLFLDKDLYHRLLNRSCKMAAKTFNPEQWNHIFFCLGLACKFQDSMNVGMLALCKRRQFPRFIAYAENKPLTIELYYPRDENALFDLYSKLPLSRLHTFCVINRNSDAHYGVQFAISLSNILSKMTNLRELSLNNLYLKKIEVQILGMALGKMRGLNRLDFEDTRLDPSALSTFADVLEKIPDYQSLNLSYTNFFGHARKIQHIQELNLRGIHYPHKKYRVIAKFLRHLPHCKVLDVGHNSLDDRALKILLPELKKMRSLTSLNLEDNEIGDRGAIALVKAFGESRRLKFLGLDFNEIQEKGSHLLREVFGPICEGLEEFPESSELKPRKVVRR